MINDIIINNTLNTRNFLITHKFFIVLSRLLQKKGFYIASHVFSISHGTLNLVLDVFYKTAIIVKYTGGKKNKIKKKDIHAI